MSGKPTDTSGRRRADDAGREPDLDAIAEIACDMTREQGDFSPLFHFYGATGQAIASAVEVFQRVGAARDQAARELGAQVARQGGCGRLVSVAQVGQGYIRILPKGRHNAADEPLDGLSPSQAPDRIEALTIVALTRDRTTPTGWRTETRLYKLLRERPGDQQSRLLGFERFPEAEAHDAVRSTNSPLLQAIMQGYSAALPRLKD